MNINKLLHGPNVAGQSLVDRVIAAKHSLTGEGLAKTVCKATTEEISPPKKKHIDCKFNGWPIHCSPAFSRLESRLCEVVFYTL